MISDIQKRLDFAKNTARSAGKILLEHFGAKQDSRMKSLREVVTKADILSEEFIIESISRKFSEPVLSEELHSTAIFDGPLWIVDPLDGTNNFSRGFPFFSVLISFAFDGKTKLGVIHDPLRDETFYTDGKKSYLNGKQIRVSDTKKLIDCISATGFPYDRTKESNLENFVRIQMAVRDVRRAGSAGLDLAYTSAGRLDFFWELGLKPWDLSAGDLLVRCAGGKTGKFDGSKFELSSDRIIAAPPQIFDKVVNIVSHGI